MLRLRLTMDVLIDNRGTAPGAVQEAMTDTMARVGADISDGIDCAVLDYDYKVKCVPLRRADFQIAFGRVYHEGLTNMTVDDKGVIHASKSDEIGTTHLDFRTYTDDGEDLG